MRVWSRASPRSARPKSSLSSGRRKRQGRGKGVVVSVVVCVGVCDGGRGERGNDNKPPPVTATAFLGSISPPALSSPRSPALSSLRSFSTPPDSPSHESQAPEQRRVPKQSLTKTATVAPL